MGAVLRFSDRQPRPLSRLQAGRCMFLAPFSKALAGSLEVLEGIARVYLPCEDTEGITIAFLGAGESIRTDQLCAEGICVEAITALSFCQPDSQDFVMGLDPVNDWTLQLLRIRHLGRTEQRLHALLSLLINRMGKRCGDWYVLPFRLTHDRIGELIGATRVTTTRMLSRLRNDQQLLVPPHESVIYLNPAFIASSPLAA